MVAMMMTNIFFHAALFLSATSSSYAFSVVPRTAKAAFSTTSPATTQSRLYSTTEDKTEAVNGKADEVAPLGKPGTAEMDKPWRELGFAFRPVKSHLRMTFKNGAWGEPELVEVSISNCLCEEKSYKFLIHLIYAMYSIAIGERVYFKVQA